MKTFEIADVQATAQTQKAVLCSIEDELIWIPQSQIHEDSEVYKEGTSGTLIVSEWFARQKGWI